MNLYDVPRLVGKINDNPEMRDEFIKLFDTKTKHEMAHFGLALGDHIIHFRDFGVCGEITEAFAAVREWTHGGVNYHRARNSAGAINDLARKQSDPVKVKFYRSMAQIACIPHVKFHALWACDFAVALINMLYPGDLDAISKERQAQIELLKGVS